MPNRPDQLERLRQALTELRALRGSFSKPAYGEIVRLVLEAHRRARTTPPL
ncbi:hypothetical protein HC776_01500 [bacterium]|nr:hypothetical protein [bacterium]